MAYKQHKNAAGKRVVSVTGALKYCKDKSDVLTYWAWDIGMQGIDLREAQQKAMNVGTVAHSLIEAHNAGLELNLDGIDPAIVTKAMTAFTAWKEWAAAMKFETIALEQSIVSEEHQYGGTFDAVAVSNKVTIFDWKTSGAVYEEYLLQVVAYAHLWNEQHPDQKAEQVCILRLGKDEPSTHCHLYQLSSVYDVCFRVFLRGVANYYDYQLLKKMV